MAVAMAQLNANATAQEDTMDIDIDMEVDDVGPIAEDQQLEEGGQNASMMGADDIEAGEVPAIYLEDPSQEPQWEKIHLRGVDDLSTDNIRRFASDYFPDADPYVQWIDDTSANLVYKDKNIARRAYKSFVMHDVADEEILNNPTIPRTAKTLITHPGSILTVRMAVMADRKRKGAREASRYYLMNPDADPGERDRRQQAALRHGEPGEYKRRRFDDAEHRRRRRHQDDSIDVSNDFAASMYDDAPADSSEKPNRSRMTSNKNARFRHRSASPVGNRDTIDLSDTDIESSYHSRRRNDYRRRDSPPPRRRNAGRELFGDASPTNAGLRSENLDLFSRITKTGSHSERSMSHDTNQGVARQLRADLKAAQNQSPMKSHRRSRAMDSRVEEDLVERFGRKSISLDSTKSIREKTANSGKELFANEGDVDMNSGGFSIKGTANQGINIKGRAGGDVKELFPGRFAGSGRSANAGKELFDQPIRNRNARRTAGDLFD